MSASAANRNPANPPAPASDAGGISANEYYASLGQTNTWKPDSVANNHYADGGGNVYRKAGNSWQQQSPNGWTDAPVAPPAVDAEASARDRAAQAAEQAGSYSMSNADRFSGNPDDGWSRQDSGDAGYSRTLGGSGGIGAEAYNYNQAVLHNEITMWNDAVTDGGVVYYGGLGWGGRIGVVVGT